MEKMASQATQTLVNSLKAMGFPAHLCEVAPQHVQSQDLEACIDWITVQLDNGNVAPAAKPAAGNVPTSAAASPEAIAALIAMGFPEEQAKFALSQNGNSVERAVEWLANS